jgi:predicted extracellular nuclease
MSPTCLSPQRAIVLAIVAIACVLSSVSTFAQGSPNLVISQVYGSGGNTGATYTNDFIEIFNRGSVPVSLGGKSLQYASAAGSGNFGGTAAQITILPSVTVNPGQYYLVQEAGGATGSPFPVTADLTVASNAINLSGSAGKVALVNSTATLGCNGGSNPCSPSQLSLIVDLLGYGSANFAEGSPAPGITASTASLRAGGGCTDTDNNASDFATIAALPRNSSSAIHLCVATTNPAVNNASAIAEIETTVLLSVAITPGTYPDSTGLTVQADLSSIGGPATQALFDDATNGDLVAGDNTFSFSYALPPSVAAATYTLPISVSDSQGRNGVGTITLTVQPRATALKINQLQGAGATSPIDPALLVKTTGIVTARKSNGFFMQSQTADDDGDPNTSEGIFVYTAGAPSTDAVVKNIVEVRGYVHEYQTGAGTDTEICGDAGCSVAETITKLATATDLPVPVAITLADEEAMRTDPNSLALEKYEGMRVTVPSLTVIAPTQGSVNESSATASSNGVFFAVVTGTQRPAREPGIEPGDVLPAGSPCCVPRFDGNPEALRVDSDGQTGASRLEVTSNATLTGVVGVLDYGASFYTILPDPGAATGITGNMTYVPVPAPDAHEVTVASFNLERFYDADSGTPSGATLTAAGFSKRLAKASLAIRNVLNTPDVLGVEEMNNLSTLQTLAAQISADALAAGQPDPQYQAYLYDGNDPSFINVAFLVKQSRIEVVEVSQEGKDSTYINPVTGQADVLNDRPPLVLHAKVKVSGKEVSIPLTVIVNHLRSLSGLTDPVDGPRVRTKRALEAEFLANLIQGMQSENVISVGDYNAYEFSDGYVDVIGTILGTPAPADQIVLSTPADLVTPHLTDLLAHPSLPADQRYSYSFDGSTQTLDHFIVNPNALALITRFAYARVDADFPESYRGDGTRPERISDHDPGVAYFAVPVDNVPPVVTVTGVTEGSTYLLGLVPAAGCSTTDALSGVATEATLSITGGDANGVGQFTATCSGALDKVGNAADPVSVHYIVAYSFSGFAPPLGSGITTKGGTIPVKFQLRDGNGNLITSTSAISGIDFAPTAGCAQTTTADWSKTIATGGTSLRFDSTASQFVYNWNVKGLSGCYLVRVTTDDTLAHTAVVSVK